MKREPLVSIIIPFYNRFNLVKEAIKSILLQTYKNIEVILIDDGSDTLLEIINGYGLNIQLKRLDENKGPGYARREGRRHAKGEYICYLDSDDWWSSNFIEECVKTIESDPDLGMVYTNTIKVVNGVETIWRVNEIRPSSILPTIFLNTKRFWSTPSCLWRNEVSLVGHWKPLRNHEDFVHDIICSTINNKIKFVRSAQTYNNHSANNRMARDTEEVRKALNEIIIIDNLTNNTGISFFYLNKIYKNKLKIKFRDLPVVLVLPFREFRLFSYKWCLFYSLVFLNISSLKRSFQKRKINKLKS